MWNLIGLVISFSLIIVLVRSGKSFGLAMLLATVVLAVFSQANLTFQETLSVFKEALTSSDTLALVAGVSFIGILANVMKETGEIGAIIEDFKTRFPQEGILASIPAVFGLLPIPGGALMSAPMVDEEGKNLEVSRSARVFLNLWFRHIGFLIFPLATPLLVLSHQAGVPLYQLILIQVPIFLISLLVGIFILWRETKDRTRTEGVKSKKSGSSLLVNISPIFVSVVLFFLLSYLTPFSIYISLMVSIPIGILVSFLVGNVKDKYPFEVVKGGFSLNLPIAVLGIMVFYKVVQSSGISGTLSDMFLGTFLPLPILIVLVSFLLGFSMGHNLGAVAVSYSILASAIGESLPMISLVYLSSFFGYLISPIHLCVAVTYEYFDPGFGSFYKLYLPPTLVVLIASTLFMTVLG